MHCESVDSASDVRFVVEALVADESFAEERLCLRVVSSRSVHEPDPCLGFGDALPVVEGERQREGLLTECLGSLVVTLVMGEDAVPAQDAGAGE